MVTEKVRWSLLREVLVTGPLLLLLHQLDVTHCETKWLIITLNNWRVCEGYPNHRVSGPDCLYNPGVGGKCVAFTGLAALYLFKTSPGIFCVCFQFTFSTSEVRLHSGKLLKPH